VRRGDSAEDMPDGLRSQDADEEKSGKDSEESQLDNPEPQRLRKSTKPRRVELMIREGIF
jgi:hypothetical protein